MQTPQTLWVTVKQHTPEIVGGGSAGVATIAQTGNSFTEVFAAGFMAIIAGIVVHEYKKWRNASKDGKE